MQRFGKDGSRLDVGKDMSPAERQWIEEIQDLAQSVLNYGSNPNDAVQLIHEDIYAINERGRGDLDHVFRQILPYIGRSGLRPACGGLTREDQAFWHGIVHGCEVVLNGNVDFFDFFGALAHDVNNLARFNYSLVVSQVSPCPFSPKVMQWAEDQDC
jgi:hypothetical protein